VVDRIDVARTRRRSTGCRERHNRYDQGSRAGRRARRADRARSIDVRTNGSTVTLSGTVRSRDEHKRAVRLARDTAGVGDVVDESRIE